VTKLPHLGGERERKKGGHHERGKRGRIPEEKKDLKKNAPVKANGMLGKNFVGD